MLQQFPKRLIRRIAHFRPRAPAREGKSIRPGATLDLQTGGAAAAAPASLASAHRPRRPGPIRESCAIWPGPEPKATDLTTTQWRRKRLTSATFQLKLTTRGTERPGSHPSPRAWGRRRRPLVDRAGASYHSKPRWARSLRQRPQPVFVRSKRCPGHPNTARRCR